MTTISGELTAFQKLAGLPHPPTPFTLEYRKAIHGEGPHAYTWSDKPHRLIFDLCGHIEAAEARARLEGAKAMQEVLDALRKAGPIHAGPIGGELGRKYPYARQCVIEFAPEQAAGAYDLHGALVRLRAALDPAQEVLGDHRSNDDGQD